MTWENVARTQIAHTFDALDEPDLTDPTKARHFADRIERMARVAAQENDGYLVEIGAWRGDTTVRLLRVARELDREVVVVDPWIPGTQNCHGGEFKDFLENTVAYADILIILRARSQDEEVIEALEGLQMAFALVDGSHQFEDVLSDVRAVRNGALVVMDDVRLVGFKGPRQALDAFVSESGRPAVTAGHRGIREGYLIGPGFPRNGEEVR